MGALQSHGRCSSVIGDSEVRPIFIEGRFVFVILRLLKEGENGRDKKGTQIYDSGCSQLRCVRSQRRAGLEPHATFQIKCEHNWKVGCML